MENAAKKIECTSPYCLLFERAINAYKNKKTIKKRKRSKAISRILIFFMLMLSIVGLTGRVHASNSGDEGFSQNINDILDAINTSELDTLLNELSDEERALFGSTSAGDRVREIVNGKVKLDYDSFFTYFFQLIGISINKMLPFMLTLIGISVAFAFMSAIKGKFASSSIESIISFAFMSIIIVLVLSQLMIVITNTSKIIISIQKQMNIIFPIILTLMTAIGSVSSVSVYQPAVAVLSSGISELVVTLILPMFMLSIIFSVVGSISGGIKLSKLSDFFMSSIKSLMSAIFFIFLAFLSLQGITASIYDSVSIRATKFAINNYVPIIGGYLSEGLNLVMAGSVLIKNAVGMCAVLILIITIVPMLLQIIIFRLSLSFVAAVTEPLGSETASKLLTQISKCLKTLIAIVFGFFFLYFVFLLLVVCTGNLIL